MSIHFAKNRYGEKHRSRKLDPEDVLLIKALREEGLTLQSIAEKFEVSKTHVHKIVHNMTWVGL